jgi:hypothetical protein
MTIITNHCSFNSTMYSFIMGEIATQDINADEERFHIEG